MNFSRPVSLHVRNGLASGQIVHADLAQRTLRIGRNPAAQLWLAEEHVSAEHAELRWIDSQVVIVDLGSTNGTRVLRNGLALLVPPKGLALQPDDLLAIGDAASPVMLALDIAPQSEKPAVQELPEALLATTHIGSTQDLQQRVGTDHALLHFLLQNFKRLSEPLEIGPILAITIEALFELLPNASTITISLTNEQNDTVPTEHFVPVIVRHRDNHSRPYRKVSRWLLDRLRTDKEAVLAADRSAFSSSHSMQQAGIDACIAAPLWANERLIGFIQVDHRVAQSMAPLCQPFSHDDLDRTVILAEHVALAIDRARLYQNLRLSREQLAGENRFLKHKAAQTNPTIIGNSAPIAAVFRLIERVKDTNIPICLTGETGTGKEIVARHIHFRSNRSDRLFVAQNCAAIPEDLLESELFGHVKGAFTGADHEKKGLFEIADGGTIFLDEVGETSPSTQVKLLRVLQEGDFRPVGATREKHVQVRVISATNRNLEEMVHSGTFRKDLYYRLNVFPFALPPLRDRGDDVRLLAEHFMDLYAREFGRAPLAFSSAAMDLLLAHKWPGNIRELQNEVQRILICATENDFVLAHDLSPRIRQVEKTLEHAGDDPSANLRTRMAQLERYILIEALRANDNNKSKTAKALDITREGLHKKLARFNIY